MPVADLDAATLNRFESLGDNCEFGFVARKLGFEEGSLFRWARLPTEGLAALLGRSLAGAYEFDQLVPMARNMVRERTYNIGWHSRMFSERVGKDLVFVDQETERRAKYEIERNKFAYLTDKFLKRLRGGNIVYVIKRNGGIPPRLLERVHGRLQALAQGASFWLLEVRATTDAALAGRVEAVGEGRLLGHVRDFAPYDRADACDYASWFALIRNAARLTQGDGAPAPQATQTRLAFPARRETHDPLRIAQETAFGTAEITTRNEWCRIVEENFRLHAHRPEGEPDCLRWTLPGAAGMVRLHLAAWLAVPPSRPVTLLVTLEEGGRSLCEARIDIVSRARAQVELMALAGREALAVTASALLPPASPPGAFAVIDLAVPILTRG